MLDSVVLMNFVLIGEKGVNIRTNFTYIKTKNILSATPSDAVMRNKIYESVFSLYVEREKTHICYVLYTIICLYLLDESELIFRTE